MRYTQLTTVERHDIAALRMFRVGQAEIARIIGRNPATISRELRRNRCSHDGGYRAEHACEKASGRRRRSRTESHFSERVWRRISALIREDHSPEQISGLLARTGELSISHETIYRHVWRDWQQGGDLHTHLRGARKRRRKRYGRYDSRGRLAGKRHISERPKAAERRLTTGHWEIDTVMGKTKKCILTLVDRKSGFLQIGLLDARTVEQTNSRIRKLIGRRPNRYESITSDNGSEFHGYKSIELSHGVPFFFCTPHHSWERGTNENTNGLIRQYLPKGSSMELLTQARCNAIAEKLNNRPRKRHGFLTPNQIFKPNANVALHS